MNAYPKIVTTRSSSIRSTSVLSANDKDYTDLQAQFSLAYVSAVAAVGGFFAEEQGRGADKDGIDMSILRRGPLGLARSPRLDLQVKSEGRIAPAENPFSYKLKAKNYNDLCGVGFHSPRLLVVVLVPEDAAHWMGHSEAELALRHCGYWASLATESSLPDGATSKTIKIDRANVFSPQSLTDIMDRIAKNLPL